MGAPVILVFELNWTGTVHAPGNSATIQAIASACPGHRIRVHAEPGHLEELLRDAALAAHPGIEFHAISVHPAFQGRPGIVSWRRFRHEFATMRCALRAVPPGEPCLIMAISTTSTGAFAAALAARLRPGTWSQIGLHGDLNELTQPRSRHPLRRAFDLVAAMRRPSRRQRFLVLDPSIRDALATLMPAAARRTDVLPLPINTAEMPCAAPGLDLPVRIGFVGQATAAKGIDQFLAIARAVKARHGARVEFHVIGRAFPGAVLPDQSPLAEPIPTDYLPRAEFVRRIAALHYVCLPLAGSYYRLAASGALIDAVTWLKPVIAGTAPIVAGWFARFGDIGHACADAQGMEAAIEAILREMDAPRYAAQVEALRRARASREPEALARQYAAIVAAHFPALAGPARAEQAEPRRWTALRA